jgi:predicted oxidoreductase (fatty acid repression mutant protein)
MVETKFNNKTNILETNYLGEVSCDEVVDYIVATKLNSELPRTLKIISDTRKGVFNFSIEDLGKIVDANNQSLEHYDAIIDAIIVDNPKNTVLTVLFKQLATTKKYKFEIFASKSAAINWLNKW